MREKFSNKALFRLMIPLAIEQLLLITVGMADTMMVSNVGEAAVSGISLVDTVNILLIQLFAALATGGAVIASQYLGKRDTQNARVCAKQLLYSTALLSIAIGILALVFNRFILQLFFKNVEPAVMQAAETYFTLSALSYPFLGIYNAGAALFRSMGNSKVSLYASVLMNIVNISGNAILIYVFKLGVTGAGIASLVSRMLAAVMVIVLLLNRTNPIYLEKPLSYKFNSSMLKTILKIGVPSGVEGAMFQVGKLLLAGLTASLGTVAITANAIAGNLAGLTNVVGSAVAMSLLTVIGQCVGAKEYENAVYFTKKLMFISYVGMFFLSAFMFIVTVPVISIYNTSPETAHLAKEILYIAYAANIFFWPASFTLPNALRAAGDVKFTMTASMLSMWTCRIALSYVLNYFGFGLTGIWIAMTIDWAFRALVYWLRFKKGKWKSIRVL